MANSDLASALDRIAPRPGLTVKFTFTSAASAAQAITFHNPAAVGGFRVTQGPLYVSVKTTAACHPVFGSVSLADPTNADALLEASDSWQDFIIMPDMTHFKVKGDSTGGDLYVMVSGT